MFEKYLIVSGSLHNIGPDDAPTGFTFEAKLGYYRGLGLSMVEDLALVVDGVDVPTASIRFDEGNGPLTLAEMEMAYDRRWAFGAKATITVLQPGGLSKGSHTLKFTERLRVSYMPFPSVRVSEAVELVQ